MATDEEAVGTLMQRLRERFPDIAEAIGARLEEGKLVPFERLPVEEQTRRSDAVNEALRESKTIGTGGRTRKADVTRIALSPPEQLEILIQFIRSLGYSVLGAREALRDLAGDPSALEVTFVEPASAEAAVQEVPEVEQAVGPSASGQQREVSIDPAPDREAALRHALDELNTRIGIGEEGQA